ncbi:very long chain fatty acid elongase 6-like isoform X1 [Tachypleus tridentatus]|uniref:very long chain fatty acid elongase 6-like isoform X1 n=2 Tax=Tachypleus tridentatus TaxID=6853 RepID=UPI003FCF1613
MTVANFTMSVVTSNFRVSANTPNYAYVFNFEQDFDQRENRDWMINNWYQAFYFVGAYMVFVFGGQAYMQSRPRYELRRVLAAWNVFLAAFSIIGTVRTLPEMIHVLREYGLQHSVCNPSFIEQVKVSGFWTWMFTLSKVPELGDTIFIILRKQNLVFLHWYHHITVLLFSWYSYTEHIAPARWYVVMNYIVHSIMYSYFALRALRYNVPRYVAMVITTSQILQMVVGAYVSYLGYQVKLRGEFCQISEDTAKLAILMYLSYFVLFARLFYNAYLQPKRGKLQKSE